MIATRYDTEEALRARVDDLTAENTYLLKKNKQVGEMAARQWKRKRELATELQETKDRLWGAEVNDDLTGNWSLELERLLARVLPVLRQSVSDDTADLLEEVKGFVECAEKWGELSRRGNNEGVKSPLVALTAELNELRAELDDWLEVLEPNDDAYMAMAAKRQARREQK